MDLLPPMSMLLCRATLDAYMSELAKVQKLLEADPNNQDYLSLQKNLVEFIHLTRVSARQNSAKSEAGKLPGKDAKKASQEGAAETPTPAPKAESQSTPASKRAAARKAAVEGKSIGIDLGTT